MVEEEEDRKRVLGVEGQVWRWRWGEMDAIQFWRGNGQEKWAGGRRRIEEEEMSFPSSPNRFFHYIAFERLLFLPEHNNAQIKILCPRTNRTRPPFHYFNNSSGDFLRRFFAPSSNTNLPVRKMGVRALQLSVFILPPLSVRVLSFAPGNQGERARKKGAGCCCSVPVSKSPSLISIHS